MAEPPLRCSGFTFPLSHLAGPDHQPRRTGGPVWGKPNIFGGRVTTAA
jgi:hypothetical protein